VCVGDISGLSVVSLCGATFESHKPVLAHASTIICSNVESGWLFVDVGKNEFAAQRHKQIHAEADTIWKVQSCGMFVIAAFFFKQD